MRSRLAIGLILFLCACGSGNPNGGSGGSAGSGGGSAGSGGTAGGGTGGSGGGTGGNGSGDMAGDNNNNSDASVTYGCNEVLSCIAMCGGAGNRQCVTMCRSGASMMGRGLYMELSNCYRQACYTHPDASSEPCMTTGMPSTACNQCLTDAQTGACSSEYAACAADST